MEWLYYIYNGIISIANSITSTFSYVVSIFKTFWYGLTTLLSGMYDLVVELFNSGLF